MSTRNEPWEMSRASSVRYLSLDELLAIHEQLIDRFGGASGLRDMGLLEMKYSLSGQINIIARDKEEITKQIEKLIKVEYKVSDDVLSAISGLPYRVEEENSDFASKLYKTGVFEIYLLPKGWFDIPNIGDNPDLVSTAVERIEYLIDKLPDDLKSFLRM